MRTQGARTQGASREGGGGKGDARAAGPHPCLTQPFLCAVVCLARSVPGTYPAGPCDLVFASDTVYREAQVPLFVRIIDALCVPADCSERCSRVLFSAPEVRQGVREFVVAMGEAGFRLADTRGCPPAWCDPALYGLSELEAVVLFPTMFSDSFRLWEFVRGTGPGCDGVAFLDFVHAAS